MHRLENPKTILVGLGIINAIVLVMTIVTVLTGISSDEVSDMASLVQDINTFEVPTKQQMQEDRTQRITLAQMYEDELKQDVIGLKENGNYDEFEKKYGEDLTAVFSEELKNGTLENISIMSRALNHTSDLQMLMVILDNETMVYIEHSVLDDEWVPAYVYREGVAE